MKKQARGFIISFAVTLPIVFLVFWLLGDSKGKQPKELTVYEIKDNDSDNTAEEPAVPKLAEEFLGNYQGIQPGYFMKNQYGDDMILGGNKVPVPSSDFKFLLKANNVVSLQQTNLEDNNRYYYDGSYTIISDDTESITSECSLNDGKGSSPTYILEISKTDKTGKCMGNPGEPEFQILMIK